VPRNSEVGLIRVAEGSAQMIVERHEELVKGRMLRT
jgi:hypothetical protein